jgi:hypothetical protein
MRTRRQQRAVCLDDDIKTTFAKMFETHHRFHNAAIASTREETNTFEGIHAVSAMRSVN